MIAEQLGYPHPDLMLDQLSAQQFVELLTYHSTQQEFDRRRKIRANEASLENLFARVRMKNAKQQGLRGQGTG